MAQDALSIYTDTEVKDKLAEIYAGILESIQKSAVSERIKNKKYSGDANSGSVTIDRFKNAVAQDYGTARTAGKGTRVTNSGKVIINIDTDKEIVEEIENKDLRLGNVKDLLERRTSNFTQMMIANLDTAFFNTAVTAGKAFEFSNGATIAEKLEEIIQAIETTKNDFVDGVDREMIVLTVTPNVYGKLQNYIDSVPNSLTGLTDNMFHNVKIYSNHRQTKDVICMIDGAVGQLVLTNEIDFSPIELSNASAVAEFYSFGTKAVTPDLIKYANLADEIEGV